MYKNLVQLDTTDKYDIIIIGAGLTGMALAYYLRNSGKRILIIEGRNRIGGRILTRDNTNEAPQEMGATWLSRQHSSLINLLQELGIQTFPQVLSDHAIYEPISTSPPQLVQLPRNNEPSYRIEGGTFSIIGKLKTLISDTDIHLNEKANSIQGHENYIAVHSDKGSYLADKVVSTLPPYLLGKNIEVSPALPHSVMDIMNKTHTWMGESIKVSLSYAEPFWREKNLSGTIYSNIGPITEMYDHSDYEDKLFSIMGFVNNSYYSISKEERLQMILKQLSKYYGEITHNYINYEEKVWRNDVMTYATYDDHLLPHQNNGHKIYQQSYLSGRLYIAGAETSSAHPGYMDGAVISAIYVSKNLINSGKTSEE